MQEKFNAAVEDYDHLVNDLLIGVFIHIKEHAAFFLDLCVAKISQVDQDFLGRVSQVVDGSEAVGQEELHIIIVEPQNVSFNLRFEVGVVTKDLFEQHMIDSAESCVKFCFDRLRPSTFVQERYLSKVVSTH